MDVQQNRDVYGTIKKELTGAFSPPQSWDHLGKPRLLFRLDRKISANTILMAYDFFVDLYQLSGTPIHPLRVGDGCVAIDALPEHTCDMTGKDLRQCFLADKAYHDFCSEFKVQKLQFHWFPAVLKQTNHDIEMFFDTNGRPVVAR